MNKHSQNRVLPAARLVLLVGGVAGGWLLPSIAVPGSRVETGVPGAPLRATARVNFKIIVPKVLYLKVGDPDELTLGAQRVAVMSNGRNATLNATVRTLETHPAGRGNLILSAAGRKIIAQDAGCSLGPGKVAAPHAAHVVCTLSMP